VDMRRGNERTTGHTKKIIDFRNARDWVQFHDPKNLAEATGTRVKIEFIAA